MIIGVGVDICGVARFAAMLARRPKMVERLFNSPAVQLPDGTRRQPAALAARFAAQLGFRPVPEVVAAMTAMADRIAIVSAERVRDELIKTIMAPNPQQAALRVRREQAREIRQAQSRSLYDTGRRLA